MRIFFLVAVLLLSITAPAAAQAPMDAAAVRAKLEASIRALHREKAGRTASERKIASRLLHATRLRRGEPIPDGIHRRDSVRWAADGTTAVDIRADVSDGLLDEIEALGGFVVNAYERYDAIRAHLPEHAIGALAERGDVRGIRPAARHQMRKVDTSEGDVAHRADDARALHSVDGTGLSIGVLSDGVDTLAARQASGDLPLGVTVLPGQAGSGDEGTAMLEIVFDLAPGASLLFATAVAGQASFAANIGALEAAGADVIVDDIGYPVDAVFQDDIVAAAVDDVTALGALYFSAAGNDGNVNDGTSGSWEGDYVDSGALIDTVPVHDYGGGTTENTIDEDSFEFILKWSDPLGGSGNDYDLLLTDCAGGVIAAGDDFQTGTQDPIEVIDSELFDDSGNCLAVARFSGADRYLQVHTFGGELALTTPGAIYGHPAARGAVAVAATDWLLAGGVGGEFDGSESVQLFSSDGPRRVFYEDDGTPITPGNFSSTGGELRSKPDLTGADGVSTSTPGFNPFFGTSAAAPHLAAIAAVLFEVGGGGTTAADVRTAMETSALDIEAVGDDRDSGHGIVETVAAAAVLLPEPGSASMLGTGALLIVGLARRRGAI